MYKKTRCIVIYKLLIEKILQRINLECSKGYIATAWSTYHFSELKKIL